MHSGAPPKKATRLSRIRPFYVMEVLEKAFRMVTSGADVIHLQMGEPDFSTPDPITRAGIRALEERRTRYTQALGIPELREKIALSYPETCRPPVDRIAVTPGSSAGLQMVFACLVDPGDEVLLADPNYPCNFNFIKLYGGNPRALPADASTGYQLTAEMIRHAWTPQTRAVLIGSPSNPTGSVVSREQMGAIARTVRALGGHLIVDEIYHGLVYDADLRSALHDGDDIFVVNSFSKFYGMTGWRLGWMVVPDAFIDEITRLTQNLFISASTPAQFAALHAFDGETLDELERRRALFQTRRDFFVPALRELGFSVPLMPQGAFYVYADSSRFSDDSDALAMDMLEKALVGSAPGKDFGAYRHREHLRFSYANSLENIERAVDRMAGYLKQR
ncbi:MAG: aminotransferase class I/II-fold pyridoxal phosphate-dependent enzyme [Chromatiales bacterium]|nr:aminotransferase class I/II-fold pyridoxal phosphate-dependent enzyme [Chromatiales bacterium]